MGRKFLIIVILLLILLGIGVFSLWLLGRHVSQTASTTKLATSTPFYLQDQTDTDHDGLKDWEEGLWRTNATNPDTDGDGTADGEEIKEDRDPLKAAPGDELAKPEDKLNTLLSQALSQRTTPLTTPTPAVLQQGAQTYTLASLKVGAETPLVRQQYATGFRIFLDRLNAYTAANAVELTVTYIDTKDQSKIDQLIAMKNFFGAQSTALANLVIPPSATSTHLALLNSLTHLTSNLDQMAKIATDPVLALSATQVYPRAVMDLLADLAAGDLYFKKYGIVFK